MKSKLAASGLLRLVSVVGARPQIIKAATVSRVIASSPGMQETLVHTGQHYDAGMSAVFFEELGIPLPAYNLGVQGGSHGAMTGRMLEQLETLLMELRPDVLVAYGDTNSTIAAALAAVKLHIPVAHVEAGLRSFDRSMPEEVNRVVTDHLSADLFCPTTTAVANVAAEGIVEGVHLVGDVMYDGVLWAKERSRERSTITERLGVQDGEYAVATIHRAENTANKAALDRAMGYLRERSSDTTIILPLHPRTRAAAERWSVCLDGLTVIKPIGYLDMCRLLTGATIVYTDSGGLQKEAYFFNVPCVTLRDSTEWTETIEAGWNRLWTVDQYRPRTKIYEYGDGTAANRVVSTLLADRRSEGAS